MTRGLPGQLESGETGWLHMMMSSTGPGTDPTAGRIIPLAAQLGHEEKVMTQKIKI